MVNDQGDGGGWGIAGDARKTHGELKYVAVGFGWMVTKVYEFKFLPRALDGKFSLSGMLAEEQYMLGALALGISQL